MAGMVKGPAIFLAQFAGDAAPFNSFAAICGWAASLGYKGVQIPAWDGRLIDLAKAADSQTYCDELKGVAASHGLAITELATHLQGQLVAVNPAYDEAFDAICAAGGAWQAGRAAKMGGAADALRREGFGAPGPQGACDVFRRAGLAVRLSLAAARARADRDGVRRTGAAMAADPRRLRRSRLRRRLRNPSRRGPVRRDDVRALPRGDGRPQALQHPLRSLAFRAAAARLSRLTSTSITSGSKPSTSRTPSSIRRAGRASTRVMRRGSSAPGASVRSATARSISAPSSRSWRSTASRPGRCWNGNAASSIPRTARARARNSSRATSSG